MQDPNDPDPEARSSLFDFLPIGAYRSLPDGGRLLRANPALVRFNGYRSEAELLAAVHDIAREWYVEPRRRDEFRTTMEREGFVRGFISEVHRHATRERAWISENAHALRDARGAVLCYEGTVEDITERVQAQATLLENERRWRLALESIGDGFWDWYPQDGREFVSPGMLRMYGLGPTDHDGRADSLDDRTHPEDRAEMSAARARHLRGETPVYVNEHRVRCADGSWKWVLTRGVVIERDSSGRALRTIGSHADISERKEAEALRAERDRAAAAQRAQSAFLSRVSHELRTPLNAIMGFAELLEAQKVGTPRQQDWIRAVVDSGHHLLALVNDLLELSSAQTGQRPIELRRVDLVAAARAAWALQSANAGARGLGLVDRLPADAAVRADPLRLAQVLAHLFSNAIKYNRAGGRVELRLAYAGAMLELEIEDEGAGLDAAKLARLFNPFERLGAQSTKIPGTGLGLALARQLAEAMGGAIAVRSEPGQGSTFTLRLAADGTERADEPKAART